MHLHDTLKLAVYGMPAIQRRRCFQGKIVCIGTSENELSVCNAVALEKDGNRGASFNIWLFQMQMKQQGVVIFQGTPKGYV